MTINDQMARPHSENNPSTSHDVNEGSSHQFRRPYIEQESQCTSQTQSYPRRVINESQHPYGIQKEVENDQRREHGQLITGRRTDYMSDDGASSLSGDSRWRCQVKNTRSCSLTSDTRRPKHHGRASYPSSTSSSRYVLNDPKLGRMEPRSGTSSYSSSKSSIPMKQENSYNSHITTSERSLGPVCRICHEGDHREVMISPCYCAGSMGLLHVSCLQRWLGSSNKTTCEICGFHFTMTRSPKPFREFFRDPGTRRDKKNLICDIASFLLITPLTIGTTWLSVAGALKYYSDKGLEKTGLIGLASTLWFFYLIWFLVAARHNWRLWKDWVKFHQDVTLICSPNSSQAQRQTGAKLGFRSSTSGVHLQGIQIKVSGPVARYQKKVGPVQSRKPSSTDAAGKGPDKHLLLQASRVKTAGIRHSLHNIPVLEQIQMVPNYYISGHDNSGISQFKDHRHETGHVAKHGHHFSQMKGKEECVYLGEKQGYHSDQERGCVKKLFAPLLETPEKENDTTQPICDKFRDSAAIFSRGNSPEDIVAADDDDIVASLQYTEDWLDSDN